MIIIDKIVDMIMFYAILKAKREYGKYNINFYIDCFNNNAYS